MAFSFPKIFKKKLKPKSKPSYSPKTEQDITLAMADLALKGPRWIGEQMGDDLDEAFNIGKTRVSLVKLVRHPVKTTKKLAKAWTISSWKKNLKAELVAEYVWEPRLAHFVQSGSISDVERAAILDWAAKIEGHKRDIAFEQLEGLRSRGNIGDDVWQGIERQHQWDELARFRRKRGRYLWEKVAGKRGTKEARLYKYTPQKWLGEPLGKALGKTALGKAVAKIKHGARVLVGKVVDAGKKVVRVVTKAVVKVAEKAAIKVAGQATVAAISSAIGGVLGSAGGPAGTIIGFLAGPIVTKLLSWLLKVACAACGCAAIVFVGFFAFVMVVIFGAFRPPDTGGLGPEQLVEVVKTVSPTHMDKGAVWPDTEASYTITVTNKTDKEITGGVLVDTHKPVDFNANTLSGGDWDPATGKLTWSDITIAPNDSFSVKPKGEILDTSSDKVVTNTVTFTGTMEGEAVSDTAMASVVVGEPVGQPPSGWPTDSGCITQGPNTVDPPGTNDASHESKEAIDIGESKGQYVYATHDGEAFSTYWDGASIGGNLVVVLSEGFRTLYAHLQTINPAIAPNKCPVYVEKGQLLGTVGDTGRSTGPHLHYEFIGDYLGSELEMGPPYIPETIGSCVNDCNCCFSGFDGVCGSGP